MENKFDQLLNEYFDGYHTEEFKKNFNEMYRIIKYFNSSEAKNMLDKDGIKIAKKLDDNVEKFVRILGGQYGGFWGED